MILQIVIYQSNDLKLKWALAHSKKKFPTSRAHVVIEHPCFSVYFFIIESNPGDLLSAIYFEQNLTSAVLVNLWRGQRKTMTYLKKYLWVLSVIIYTQGFKKVNKATIKINLKEFKYEFRPVLRYQQTKSAQSLFHIKTLVAHKILIINRPRWKISPQLSNVLLKAIAWLVHICAIVRTLH